MAKHGLCDATFQQIILLCQSISPALGNILKEVRSMHSSFFAQLQSISNDFVRNLEEQQQYCEATRRDIQNIEEECKELMDATALLDQVAAVVCFLCSYNCLANTIAGSSRKQSNHSGSPPAAP